MSIPTTSTEARDPFFDTVEKTEGAMSRATDISKNPECLEDITREQKNEKKIVIESNRSCQNDLVDFDGPLDPENPLNV